MFRDGQCVGQYVTNSGATVTLNFGQTLTAGTKVEFDAAVYVPGLADKCTGNGYVMIRIGAANTNTQYQYWHFDGKVRHSQITLSADCDALTIYIAEINPNDIPGTANTSATEIYFDNITLS